MNALRSEQLSRRLWLAMLVIVLSVALISLPLIAGSYRSYRSSAEALQEIQSLKMLAELSNKISRERAPANNAMSSPRAALPEQLQALREYRAEVDLQIQRTAEVLKRSGFAPAALELERNLKPALAFGRRAVDGYIALPDEQRRPQQLDQAIASMFMAWDKSHEVLQHVVSRSQGKDTALSNYYTLILLLADLRDQAGRTASNIMAAVTFNEPVPEENLARFMQTQRQTQYLWQLVNVVQPEHDKTPQFQALHRRVKSEFLDQGLPIIAGLVDESLKGQPYSMTGPELTQAIVGKFSTVVALQDYILQYSVEAAQHEQRQAKKNLVYAILMVLVSLLAVVLTMIYARKWVFEPLITARRQLFELAQLEDRPAAESSRHRQGSSIFDAISRLQKKLQQREALEFQLKHIAHSDSLTGIANRFALDEYIKLLEKQPSQFKQSCLMIIDIDNFKRVNDSCGHIVGDQVIQAVAENLKSSVRASDLLVRYGGDEFLVLMETISLETALKIAEKIRKSVLASEIFQCEELADVNVSISAGVAVGAASWMALLAKADEALFRAKAKGKNTVSS